MINVLMLMSNLRVSNGIASFAMNYFRKLDHQKVQMDFVLYSDLPSPYYDEIRRAGSNIFILPNIKNLAKHLQACNTILKQGHYDVVHDNIMHITIPMMLCAMCNHVPVRILHSHNSKLAETRIKELRNKLFLPLLLLPATEYLACSDLAGKLLFGNHDFTVVPNVISGEKFQFSNEKRNKLRLEVGAESKCVVGSVGRLAEQKNPFFAMDVFKIFLSLMPNAEYWWVGDGPLNEEVKQYVHKKGLDHSVKLLGSRTDVADLYQAMDVFFMPSLFEGLPLTAVEAQAIGLPMVVANTVTDEMVYTDLIDSVSLKVAPKMWAEHLRQAALKQVERKKYTENLKNSLYSDINCGERLTEIYNRLLNKNIF